VAAIALPPRTQPRSGLKAEGSGVPDSGTQASRPAVQGGSLQAGPDSGGRARRGGRGGGRSDFIELGDAEANRQREAVASDSPPGRGWRRHRPWSRVAAAAGPGACSSRRRPRPCAVYSGRASPDLEAGGTLPCGKRSALATEPGWISQPMKRASSSARPGCAGHARAVETIFSGSHSSAPAPASAAPPQSRRRYGRACRPRSSPAPGRRLRLDRDLR
jgi:hypothetical protein